MKSVWSGRPGDGAGLHTFEFGRFPSRRAELLGKLDAAGALGSLRAGRGSACRELAGNAHNTEQITPFIARKARSFVLSASTLMRREDIPEHIPHAELLRARLPEVCADGGSCIAGPDGEWLVPPRIDEEVLLLAELDHARIRDERQNFDPSVTILDPMSSSCMSIATSQRCAVYSMSAGALSKSTSGN